MKFLGQCISGLQDVVASQLAAARIEHREDGLLVFSAEDEAPFVKLPYFNNVYQVLAAAEGGDINALMARLLSVRSWSSGGRSGKGRTFRLTLSDENRLVSGDKKLLGQLISRLEQASGLSYTAGRPDVEFWLIRRASGQGWLARRLTYGRKTEKDLQPGEVRPELAQLLCLLSDPQPEDVVLEPFAGSGAIAFARAARPYNMIFASDCDVEKVKAMKQALAGPFKRLERKGHPFIIREADATALTRIQDGFIDKVITDPPWGLFDRELADVPGFYQAVFTELCRVVKPGGLIVLLLGRRELIDGLNRAFRGWLSEEQRYDVLVSGKKASILRYRRVG